jgi:hypothetical protein
MRLPELTNCYKVLSGTVIVIIKSFSFHYKLRLPRMELRWPMKTNKRCPPDYGHHR